MNIHELRRQADREEIDYPFLMSALQHYANPRQKISQWLNKGELIRVKKGLYVFGQQASLRAYSKELLANLIYGPSVLSSFYALAHYSLIPERVETLTSITNQRNKEIQTPIGLFTYQYLATERYHLGIQQIVISADQHYLMTIPEKALCDAIYLSNNNLQIKTIEDIEFLLLEDLRIDPEALSRLSHHKMNMLAMTYKQKSIILLAEYLKKGGAHA